MLITTRARERQIAEEFLKKHFTNCFAALLTGSVIDETFNKDSDIDILIIDSNEDKIIIENFIFLKNEIQVIIVSEWNLELLLITEYINNTILYTSMISKGLIIKDTDSYFSNIKKNVNRINKIPRIQNLDYNKLRIRKVITTLKKDFENSNNLQESFILGSDMIKNLSHLELMNKISTFRTGKFLGRLFDKYNDEADFEKVTKSFANFILNDQKDIFLNEFTNVFNKFGGYLTKSATNLLLIDIEEDGFVIQISSNKGDITISPIILEQLSKLLSPYKYYQLKLNDNLFLDHGIYVIVNEAKRTSAEIIGKLNTYVIYNEKRLRLNNLRLKYPLQTSLFEGFDVGGKKSLGEVSKYYIKLSKLFINTYLQRKEMNVQDSLKDSIFIILSFGISSNLSKTEFKDFLTSYYEFILPKSFNNECVSNYKIINRTINEYRCNHDNFAKQNTTQVKRYFEKSISNWSILDLPTSDYNEFTINLNKLFQILNELNENNELHYYYANTINNSKIYIIYINILNKFLDIMHISNDIKPFVINLVITILK